MHCLLYARLSTDKQAQKDLSIPAQLQLMREYAKKQGWTVVAHYVDEGESARTAAGPSLSASCSTARSIRASVTAWLVVVTTVLMVFASSLSFRTGHELSQQTLVFDTGKSADGSAARTRG